MTDCSCARAPGDGDDPSPEGQEEGPGAPRDLVLESLEREVGVLMRRARRVIGLRAALVHPDLMPTTYLVLSHVCESGTVRASGIAERFQLDKGAVSRHVQQLVELGLVERAPDPEDRRATLLRPTEEALERMRQVLVQRRRRIREGLGEWDDAALTRFVDDLRRYNEALEWLDQVEQPSGTCCC